MNRHLIGFASLLSLVLSACGPSGENQNSFGKSFDRDSDGSFEEFYRFKYNSCDTGLHGFNSGQDGVARKQLCKTLQDDAENNRCAESMRQEFFQKKCPGQAWQVIRESNPAPIDPISATPEVNPGSPKPSKPTEPPKPPRPQVHPSFTGQQLEAVQTPTIPFARQLT